jgi:flagellar biosynthesis protein FlhA
MPAADNQEASWSDVSPVDVLGLEVGYRLIPMVDKGQDGELLKRIRGLRKKFAQEVGFLSAPVHIRDNLELKPNAYRIALKGVEVGSGEAYPGSSMAINPGRVSGPLPARETTDPAFGLPAVWIDAGHARAGARARLHRGRRQHRGGDPPQPRHPQPCRRAARPPGDPGPARPHRPRIAQAGRGPGAQAAAAGTVQRVLQNLLEEGVNIRDMRSIIESSPSTRRASRIRLELTTRVREALGRAIVQGCSRATPRSR